MRVCGTDDAGMALREAKASIDSHHAGFRATLQFQRVKIGRQTFDHEEEDRGLAPAEVWKQVDEPLTKGEPVIVIESEAGNQTSDATNRIGSPSLASRKTKQKGLIVPRAKEFCQPFARLATPPGREAYWSRRRFSGLPIAPCLRLVLRLRRISLSLRALPDGFSRGEPCEHTIRLFPSSAHPCTLDPLIS